LDSPCFTSKIYDKNGLHPNVPGIDFQDFADDFSVRRFFSPAFKMGLTICRETGFFSVSRSTVGQSLPA
jgi:hypothetical protein